MTAATAINTRTDAQLLDILKCVLFVYVCVCVCLSCLFGLCCVVLYFCARSSMGVSSCNALSVDCKIGSVDLRSIAWV